MITYSDFLRKFADEIEVQQHTCYMCHVVNYVHTSPENEVRTNLVKWCGGGLFAAYGETLKAAICEIEEECKTSFSMWLINCNEGDYEPTNVLRAEWLRYEADINEGKDHDIRY